MKENIEEKKKKMGKSLKIERGEIDKIDGIKKWCNIWILKIKL